jgi:hypothetical protein
MDMKVRSRRSLLVIPPIVVVVGITLACLHAASASTSGALVVRIDQSTTISVAPGRADAENTFIVSGVTAPAVRILSSSLDMNMGSTSYTGGPLDKGRWQVVNVEVPMVGRWAIKVQVRHDRTWVTVGEVTYQVPFTGRMHLIHMTKPR